MTPTLEPIEPSKAVELHLAQKEEDASARTVQAHDYRLRHFLRWCEIEGIDNMNALSGRRLYEYRLWRKDDGNLNAVSLRTQLCTLRTFLRFCESINAVEKDLYEEILLPKLDVDEDSREEMLEGARAEEIRSYLSQFEFASLRHLIFELLWATSARLGAIHSLDVGDVSVMDRSIAFTHRPASGTALKNKSRGERIVAISEDTSEVIESWIDHNRPEVIDGEGRRPLIASEHGRMSQSNIRAQTYSVTRPCEYGKECECDDKYPYGYASRCPWSRSPHMIRRGSLTHLLLNDVPKPVVSDRADVGQEVLDKHYNSMTKREKMEQRRDYLNEVSM